MKRHKRAARSGAPSQRQFRVGEELRHAVARILDRAHFRDPDLAGVPITVTEVRISPDLRNATAFVTPLGGTDMARVVAALNRASGYVRREIAREVVLRVVPQIAFEPDTSFDYASGIERLLASPAVAPDLAGDDGSDDGSEGGSGGGSGGGDGRGA